MKKLLIFVGLLVAGAVLWTYFGGEAKTQAATTLHDIAKQIK